MKIAIFFLFLTLSVTVFGIDIREDLLTDLAAEFGVEARDRVEAWQSLSESARDLPPEQQLEVVNRFFNRVPFSNDIEHWGVEDYWATPVELLATHAGDCEDYSVAKYLTLRALGIEEDRLRITYVKALELNQAHMVLTYYPTADADPLVLDNLISDIKPASQRQDLKPVYSFNGEGLWLTALERKDERRIGTPDRLKKWTSLNQRILNTLY